MKIKALIDVSCINSQCTSYSAEIEWLLRTWRPVVVLMIGVEVSPMTLTRATAVRSLWRDDGSLCFPLIIWISNCVLKLLFTWFSTRWDNSIIFWKAKSLKWNIFVTTRYLLDTNFVNIGFLTIKFAFYSIKCTLPQKTWLEFWNNLLSYYHHLLNEFIYEILYLN